ncbi:MAG: bifunctional adenosylcobinamide kinase/adenosylcobinamide-phosphate guanylyltransferase [Bacillota bacterium]|nr:bifunctional adenosylcobinamide kinase/adenosylcobinamide-phosphate guanylyltransferase [Bacillota bacterium]
MNILVSGGAKNGKSMFAQKTAKRMAEEQGVPLYYIATMIPVDGEDETRIRRHRKERAGWGFTTLERGRDLPGLLADPDIDPRGVFLLDSVTALLGNEMFPPEGAPDRNAAGRVAEDCAAFAEATGKTVFVSDYIFGSAEAYECGSSVRDEPALDKRAGAACGGANEDPENLTEIYRRGLARIDRRLTQVCGRVVEVSAGCMEDWK